MSTVDEDKEMSFLGHLEELRWRLVRSAAVIVIIAIVIFIFTSPIVEYVFLSMKDINFPTYRFFNWVTMSLGMEDGMFSKEIPIEMQSTTVTGQFSTNMYLAFVGGFIVAFPYIFYQFWSFLKPALKQTEFTVAKGSIFYGSLLFLMGIGFGYFVVCPLSVQFFGVYKVHAEVDNIFTINSYLSLITTTTLFSGLFFELPMVIMILSKLGIVSPELLKKYRKHALVVILILSAIITPPDVISQVIVAVPILILYEVGILVSKRIQKKKKAI
jgi:sec-independent protein translocase protein TatC